MADFTIDVSRSKTSRINLGIQGENIIEHIIFDISAWIEEFGDGVAYIYAQRKGDENPYPVALDMDLDAGTATWTLNATDTAVKGKGKAQLVYVVDEDGTEVITDDEIKKTRVFATTVQTSLVPASEESPDAYETWLEVLGGYTARIEAAEDDIKAWVTAQINAIDFPVDDVQVDGTSVVSDGVAEIPKATGNQFGVVKITAQGDAPGGYADITDANGTIQLPFVTDTNGVVTPIRAKYLPEATTGGKGAMSAADKEKLDGIEAGAEVNVQADWGQSDSTEDDYIKNKPGNATAYTDGFFSAANKRKLDSIEYSADVTPGVATTTSMGLMSSSDKSKLKGIEAGAEVNVQADWNQTDNTADDYIKNKPEIVQKPTYKQTFTAPSSSDFWIYRIPYSADYSFDDLINFRAYGVVTDENDVITAVKGMEYWRCDQSSTANYCDYRFYLSSSVSSGDTIIVENMFTDEGTLMASH